MSDTTNHLAQETAHHFHGRERWFGPSADQSGSDWALAETLDSYTIVSGNNTWGAVKKLLGTSDTPVVAGKKKWDAHRFLLADIDSDTIWKLQFIWGSGTSEDAIAAGQYTEVYTGVDSVAPTTLPRVPVDVMMPRLNAGVDQLWVRGWNATNLAEMEIYIGIHEYDE